MRQQQFRDQPRQAVAPPVATTTVDPYDADADANDADTEPSTRCVYRRRAPKPQHRAKSPTDNRRNHSTAPQAPDTLKVHFGRPRDELLHRVRCATSLEEALEFAIDLGQFQRAVSSTKRRRTTREKPTSTAHERVARALPATPTTEHAVQNET